MTSLLVAFLTALAIAEAAKWSYKGDSGPLYWHELFPTACSGKYQSPIDLRPEQTLYNPDLKDFAIWYDPPKKDSILLIHNNGHTVQVDLDGDFFVTNGGLANVYKALQFHFHWGHKSHHGSEHLVDGEASPIELHLVTYNHELFSDITEAVRSRGGLAVLGVMYEVTEEDNPVLEPIVKALKHIRDPEARKKISLPLMSLRNLLPSDITRYYRYNGSLTTPGCFESVTWTVFDQKQTISHKQLEVFRTMLQTRHKHRKHSDSHTADIRHRRSLTREEKRMEHRAMQALDELGIRGDEFQEMIFRKELADIRDEHMLGDDPKVELIPTMNEDRAAKIDESIDEHMDLKSTEKYQAEDSVDPANENMELVEYDYTQDVMVNNFRPVQPLNGRLVYRSFKLRQEKAETEDVEYAQIHMDKKTDNNDCNAAPVNGASLTVAALVSAVTLILLV